MEKTSQRQNLAVSASGMSLGAVAVIDALGFKGIWKRTDPRELIEEIHSLIVAAQEIETVWRESQEADRFAPMNTFVEIQPWIRSFSDTFILGSEILLYDTISTIDRPASFAWACQAAITTLARNVSFLQSLASQMLPPLLYRGAISFGHYIVDENAVIGPAVDEAAELERFAEAAVVWLAPSALDIQPKEPNDSALLIGPYPVPMKSGQATTTLVVNPFASMFWDDRHKDSDRLLQSFDSDAPDVKQKRINTERFFKVALARANSSSTVQRTMERIRERFRSAAERNRQ